VNRQRLILRVGGCLFKGCDKADRDADVEIHGDTLKMTTAAGSSPTGAFYSYTVWKR
jgi:hypothetical protein